MRSEGGRRLNEGVVHDGSGSLRLVYPTPNWEDFVHLAVTEIRQFGGTNIQVVRRLRAMLENLTEVLQPERTGLLRVELKLLDHSAARFFPEPEDQALAEVSDFQGVGEKHPAHGTTKHQPFWSSSLTRKPASLTKPRAGRVPHQQFWVTGLELSGGLFSTRPAHSYL